MLTPRDSPFKSDMAETHWASGIGDFNVFGCFASFINKKDDRQPPNLIVGLVFCLNLSIQMFNGGAFGARQVGTEIMT